LRCCARVQDQTNSGGGQLNHTGAMKVPGLSKISYREA
jgi:hypothetical protein